MNQVDEILAGHTAAVTCCGPEINVAVERYPRAPHAEKVRQLTQVSGLRSTVAIGVQWSVIIGSLVAASHWSFWYVYVITALVIATRMQALGVLLHDGVHFSLYRNRAVNDIICDLIVAFPIGMSTTLYRKTHFRHHRFVNTEQDQDLAAQKWEEEWYAWPKSRGRLVSTIVRALLGINAHKAWILYKHWSPWYNMRQAVDADFPIRARVLYVASVSAIYGLIGWGFSVNWQLTLTVCLLYVAPTMTLLNFINRVRATSEHVGTQGTHELNSTRTVVPNWIERLTIAPFNVGFHLEHHLFPSVPAYNLGRLHRYLMTDEQFQSQAHITRTYFGFFRELMTLQMPINQKGYESLTRPVDALHKTESESAK